MDLSEGKEAIRIPLIDDSGVDREKPQFTYVTSLYHTTEDADQLIQTVARHFVYKGCRKQEGLDNYDEHGCLQFTQPEGIKECPQSCSGCYNTVVSMRVRYPLEVFWTDDKEWGVRCSVDIPKGAFVCEYAGKVLTDREVVAPPFHFSKLASAAEGSFHLGTDDQCQRFNISLLTRSFL